jgi:hypothetical protein
MRTMKRRAFAADDGASLLLALIFVMTVSIVVSSLLAYSSTGLRSDRVTQNALESSTDVAGALQTAINDVRNSDYFNNPTSTLPCLGAGNLKTYPAMSATGQPITVTCAPDAASGGAGGLVHVDASNKPPLALQTLSTGGEIGLNKTGNRPLKIKGSVYVNSTIHADLTGSSCPATWPPPSNSTNCNGIYVTGPNSNPDNISVTAQDGCFGTVMTHIPGNTHCPSGHSLPGDDPATLFPSAYAQPTSGMTPRALPSCASNPVTFTPGYYDDAVGLSGLMGGSGPCRGKTFWFPPGVYYFDFHNSEMPTSGSPITPNGPNVWTFDDGFGGVLVAGTKQGWTTSTSKDNMPGSCVSPLTSETTDGVQFVFGGDSQLHLSKGSVEICGTWYVDRPSLVLYGAKTTTGSINTTELWPTPGTLTSPSTGGNPPFGSLGGSALANDSDGNAGPNVTGVTRQKTSTLNVNGFTGLSSAIVPRAVLEQASVTVRHGEQGANSGTRLTLQLKANRAGNPTISTRPLTVSVGTPSLAYRTETIDVTDDIRAELYSFGLANPGAPIIASVILDTDNVSGQSVSEQVDHLKLNLSWRPLSVRAQSGCVSAVAGCAMLETDIHTDELYIQGTAYTPKAWLDIRLVGVTGQVFRSGLVARAATLNVSPSNGYEGPLIELPDNTLAPTPLRVYLTAWSCPSGSCASPPSTVNGWRQDGRTLVQYTDGNFVPIPGQRAIDVQAWKLGP